METLSLFEKKLLIRFQCDQLSCYLQDCFFYAMNLSLLLHILTSRWSMILLLVRDDCLTMCRVFFDAFGCDHLVSSDLNTWGVTSYTPVVKSNISFFVTECFVAISVLSHFSQQFVSHLTRVCSFGVSLRPVSHSSRCVTNVSDRYAWSWVTCSGRRAYHCSICDVCWKAP